MTLAEASGPGPDWAAEALFLGARTAHLWSSDPLPDDLPVQLHDLMRWAPTSLNSNPGRFVYCMTVEAKSKLAECAFPPNREKIMTAPAVVIIAHDLRFHEHLPHLFPHGPAAGFFAANPAAAEETALRNGALQGAYLIMAARLLGLDCAPMSGFDNAAVDEAFFAGTAIRSNFLCGIGRADPAGLRPRGPRLDFQTTSSIL